MRACLPVLMLLLAPVLLHGQAATPTEVAFPLGGPPPAWYGPEIHARVLAAAEEGLAYDPAAGAAVPPPPLLMVQPGAAMVWPSACTLGFVFGTPGRFQISTAGHCVHPGDTVVVRFGGPTPMLAAIGTVSASRDNGIGDDWALITISSTYQARTSPCAAVVLGPDGAWGGSSDPTRVKWVSQDGARIGLGVVTASGSLHFLGLGAMQPGDSGAPVMTIATSPLGEAVGLLTHLILGMPAATMGGTSLVRIPASLATCP